MEKTLKTTKIKKTMQNIGVNDSIWTIMWVKMLATISGWRLWIAKLFYPEILESEEKLKKEVDTVKEESAAVIQLLEITQSENAKLANEIEKLKEEIQKKPKTDQERILEMHRTFPVIIGENTHLLNIVPVGPHNFTIIVSKNGKISEVPFQLKDSKETDVYEVVTQNATLYFTNL